MISMVIESRIIRGRWRLRRESRKGINIYDTMRPEGPIDEPKVSELSSSRIFDNGALTC